jgi:hypothetical protein
LSSEDPRATITVPWREVLVETRLEGRHAPLVQRVRGLHIVMAVEQNATPAALCGTRAPMPNHHRLPQSGLDSCLESDLAQRAGAALSRFNAGFMVNGVGRDAWNGEQPEQPL